MSMEIIFMVQAKKVRAVAAAVKRRFPRLPR
jgi:hypothetical protein